MKHTEPPKDLENLLSLLDEWRERPEPALGFEARLHRRIADAHAPARRGRFTLKFVWAPVAATFALLLGLGLFLYNGSSPVRPAAPARVQVAQTVDPMMRDLQVLSRDHDLLDHLDFLSVPISDVPARTVKD